MIVYFEIISYNRYVYAVPQPVGNQLVRRPTDTAPLDVRNEYAAWVFGNFFPYTCYDPDNVRADASGFVDLVRELLYSCYPRNIIGYNYDDMEIYDRTAWWQHLKRWEHVKMYNYEGFILPFWLKMDAEKNADININDIKRVDVPFVDNVFNFETGPSDIPSNTNDTTTISVYPRIQQDKFVLRCVSNIELQLTARSLMSSESKKAKILERRILESTGRRTTKGNTVYSDCEEVNKLLQNTKLLYIECFF